MQKAAKTKRRGLLEAKTEKERIAAENKERERAQEEAEMREHAQIEDEKRGKCMHRGTRKQRVQRKRRGPRHTSKDGP